MRCLFAALPLCLCFSSGYRVPSLDTGTFPQGLKILASSRPLVIGHRGYVQLAPENTLASFQIAIATGVDLVELDYYHSRDGIPVVLHDRTLDRTTDAEQKWGLKDLAPGSKNADELQTLDAGTWFNPRFAGERIPLLTEALQLIQPANITLIEQKQGDAATCVKLLRERDLINRVVVQSFDWSYLRDFHALVPEQILGALGTPPAGTAANWRNRRKH
jgi:glycerophosphoryl diester phosphodiesterase